MLYACITVDCRCPAASSFAHESSSLNGGLTVDGYNGSSSSTLDPSSISDLKMEGQLELVLLNISMAAGLRGMILKDENRVE